MFTEEVVGEGCGEKDKPFGGTDGGVLPEKYRTEEFEQHLWGNRNR